MGLNETLNSTDSTNSLNTSNQNNSTDDDDLTNLTWLQNHNLLQNMTNNTDESTSSDNSTNDLFHKKKEDNENVSPTKFRSLTEKDDIKEIDLENNTIITSSGTTLPCSVPPVKYNPLLHTHTKPPYSFSSLIFMAIESSPNKALPVKEIYNWITKNYPYYEKQPDGWKNTVRHNLSLNKCFQKIEKGSKLLKDANGDDKSLNDQLLSKGSLWCIDQNLRPNLLQTIKKTPAQGFIYPYMSTAKAGTNLVQIGNVINNNQLNGNINQINNINNVTISNNSTLPSNNLINQSPKKIITIEKLPQQKNVVNNVLTTGKRVLIPIVSKVAREAEEDAAESMLTLTQCSTTGVLNNGNIYIITSKGDNLLPIQLNSKPVIATTTAKPQQQTVNKNQIILTRPIISTTTATPTVGTSQPTIIQPTITTIQSDKQKQQSITTNNNTVSSPTKLTAVNTSQLTTDHNYFNRGAAFKTINNVITIPASTATAIPLTLANGQKILLNKQLISANNIATTGLTSTANFIPIKNNLINSNNKNINKIITITTNPTATTKNIIIKSPIKIQQPQQATITIEKKVTNDKKRKIDTNDEDGLMKMGAEALYSLATVKLKKTNDDQLKELSENKVSEEDKSSETKLAEDKSLEAKSSEAKSSETKSSETKSSETKTAETKTAETKKSDTKSMTPTKKTITIQTISTPTSTLTRSAAKKLKTTV